jgi:hypothetical protein
LSAQTAASLDNNAIRPAVREVETQDWRQEASLVQRWRASQETQDRRREASLMKTRFCKKFKCLNLYSLFPIP